PAAINRRDRGAREEVRSRRDLRRTGALPPVGSGRRSPELLQASGQNSFFESSRIVTGPQFTSSTSIISWKRPVSQHKPSVRMRSTKYSYNALACSGRAAASNEG